MKILKEKNGACLIKTASGYFIDPSDANFSPKYIDNKKSAEAYFKKVSKDTSPYSLSYIQRQAKNKQNNKNFRIKKFY